MKFIISFFVLSFLPCSYSHGKLLDKIVGIVDDNIITASQISRANGNLAIKKNVAPIIYDKNNYSNLEMLDLTVNRFLVRAKLSEIGYSITDDQVEAQIKTNQERLGVDRKSLMTFLKQQGSSFDEYFETLREAIEYSYFVNRVISPLISISEQDVKNTFFKNNIKDPRMSFKYSLIDYSISKEKISKMDKNQFIEVVKQYRINGVLPEDYSALHASSLDDIGEESLASELRSLLKQTDEGASTAPLFLNEAYHIFFIAKKDLTESEAFLSQKEKIRDQLFEKSVKYESALWFTRERNKHYVKISP